MSANSPDTLAQNITRCLPFAPNGDQQAAIDKLARFVLSPEMRSVFILRGYAGTGKTNLMSALTQALPSVRRRSVLLAPTGRAAKVLGQYAKRSAQTIHKKIFRKSTNEDGQVYFALAENLHRHTIFIVDEASMISADSGESLMNSLLENLFEYVYSGDDCKLILIGDNAQLPPVGSEESPALSPAYLRAAFHLHIAGAELREVARQKLESGILLNATSLRGLLGEQQAEPRLSCTADLVNLPGDELEDTLQRCIRQYGEENLIILTRSNKRANLFNQSYRSRIRLFEEDLCTGDRLMVVKNNYFWLPENSGDAAFIANGDMLEVMSIRKREELYGFHFTECQARLVDYPNLPELQVKIITDSLYSDQPALSREEQQKLYNNVLEDVADVPSKARRSLYLRESVYYNALQVKFSYAVTCHKAQGGQWPVVFIDQGYLSEDQVDQGFIRWLYTAITRATEQVYLVNFHSKFFQKGT